MVWSLRPDYETFDPNVEYAGKETMFTAKLHYGGIFKNLPRRRDLDIGLVALGCDADVRNLAQYVGENKVIHFYIEHKETNVDTYLKSPEAPKVVIEEIEDEHQNQAVPKNPRRKLLPRRRLLIEYGGEGLGCSKNVGEGEKVVDGDKLECSKNVGEGEKVVDGDKLECSKNVEAAGVEVQNVEVTNVEVEQGQNVEVEQGQNVKGENVREASFMDCFDFDEFPVGDVNMEDNVDDVVMGDNSGDNNKGGCFKESEGAAYNEGDASGEDGEDSCSEDDDSQDSDWNVDKANEVEEPDVDMRDFHTFVDEGEEYVGNNPVQNDNQDLHDFDLLAAENLSYESFDSLTDSEQSDFETRRSRKLREIRNKEKAKAKIQDACFYVGQTFGSAKQAKIAIRRHAIQTRRELSFLKNDKVRIRVVCEGNVPVFNDTQGDGPVEKPKKPRKPTKSTKQTKKPKSSKTKKGTKPNGGQGASLGESVSGPSSKKPLTANALYCLKRKERLKNVTCPYQLYLSKEQGGNETWVVKTYRPNHICLQSRDSLHFTANFMAEDQTVLNMVEATPDISIKTIQTELARKYELKVTRMKAFRAKLKATKKIQGDYKEQYSRLRDYCMELMNANPDTTVKIEVESEPNPSSPTRVFKRIYICLGPLKKGFKACKRDLIGLDGAFLKGTFQGQVLVAVGQDPNNGIYPVAWAIAEAENKDSWTWFLQCLQDDLDLDKNSHFTFISDRQKGLIPALAQVFPVAEHRFCLRHIHQNMKLQWRGQGFKDCLWECAAANTVPEFTEKMDELKKFNLEAYKWLAAIPPQHWTRSHFTGRSKSDLLINNICECFNSKTVEGRDKPIISCLEYIREYCMKRIVIVMLPQQNWKGPLTPKCTEIFDLIKKAAPQCTVKWCGDTRWQVTGTRGQYVVDVGKMECTCRRWELSGIPCKHAVAVNWDMAAHKQKVGSPESWAHPCYFTTTWKEVYTHKIGPINGSTMWPKCQVPTTLTPPFHRKQIGRPKKSRRKDQVELQDIAEAKGKLTRKGGTVTCSKCKAKGHNARGCKKTKKNQDGEAAGGAGEAAGGAN